MASIKIDGIDYNIDNISDKGKEQLASIKFVQNEIQTLEARICSIQNSINGLHQSSPERT